MRRRRNPVRHQKLVWTALGTVSRKTQPLTTPLHVIPAVSLDISRHHVGQKTRGREVNDDAVTASRRHTTCRKKDFVNTVRDSKCDEKGTSFAFKLTVDDVNSTRKNALLVEAKPHILNDESK